MYIRAFRITKLAAKPLSPDQWEKWFAVSFFLLYFDLLGDFTFGESQSLP